MALSRNDLTVFEGEARISDRRIFEALGFSKLGNLHQLIRRRNEELEDFGRIILIEQKKSGRGRPSLHFYLNEHQATAICLWAETQKARQARKLIVEVFTTWRKGEALPAPPTQSQDPISQLQRRRSAITDMAKTHGVRSFDLSLLDSLPIWSSGRRPPWWYDDEVRIFLTRTHRMMLQNDALRECEAQFGPERSPSLSALNRYWVRLDYVFGPNETRAVRSLMRRKLV